MIRNKGLAAGFLDGEGGRRQAVNRLKETKETDAHAAIVSFVALRERWTAAPRRRDRTADIDAIKEPDAGGWHGGIM